MRVFAAVLCLSLAVSVQAVYWWEYKGEDCSFVDCATCNGQPQPCSNKDVSALEASCMATDGCVGFNSNGYLKKAPCSASTMKSNDCNLYLKEDTPQPSPTPVPPTLLPRPNYMTSGTTTLFLNSNFFSFNPSPSFDDIKAAIQRYTDLMFDHTMSASVVSTRPELKALSIEVTNPTAPLQLYVNESYELTVPATGGTAVLKATTYYGALRGLETFSQLVVYDFDSGTYVLPGAPWVIQDQPRFPHRGILIDTSRHFQPLRSLRRTLDAMSYAKFNAMHWHIVDEQSTPYMSSALPKFDQGAWSNVEKYSPSDVASVVEYGRQRGIRVYPEFDTPGHAAAWCTGYPEICPSTTCLMPLNPATNVTFDTIDKLFSDVTGGKPGAGLFPDSLLHLGGDEVNTDCWTETPAVAAWLTEKGYTAQDAYLYFVSRVQEIARAQGRITVNWEEVWRNFGTQLDPSSVIHIWLSKATLANVTTHGYRGILSDSTWYLDHLTVEWEAMYMNEPLAGITNTSAWNNVLGGECCMWGETVDDSDEQETIWPRAAAVAERLWSARDVNSTTEFKPRLQWYRCLLNRRGIGAAPVDNSNARTAPPGPGSCLSQ